jgi:acetyl esterase/lipase
MAGREALIGSRTLRWGVPLVLAIVAAAVLVLSLGGADPARADLICKPGTTPRATVMLFHPGGFVSGTSDGLKSECDAFARDGYLTVSVEYPKRFFPAVERATSLARSLRRTARAAQRPLFAYGLSSGGTFAALLAERGEVDAAFSFAGVYDVAAWAGPNKPLLEAMDVSVGQLAGHAPIDVPLRRPAPLLLEHNSHDAIAPYRAAVKLARRSPRFELRTLRRPANGYAAHIAHPVAPALRWFARHLPRDR